MALYVWKCGTCGKVTKKLLEARPQLGKCNENFYKNQPAEAVGYLPCGGVLKFWSNTSSQTMEVIDNGLMAKALERPVDIEAKIAERNALADEEQK